MVEEQRVYEGIKTPGGCEVKVIYPGVAATRLPPRQDLVKHSDNGFGWDHQGPEAAQLALALLAHATESDEFALAYHQEVMRTLVVHLPRDHWFINESEIFWHLGSARIGEALNGNAAIRSFCETTKE